MNALPAITCLCPTYGRLERLRDAVACFLLQDYPPRRLLILNDARIPLCGGAAGPWGVVEIWNVAPRFETLGAKRQALLRAARTPLVAHWDDDDLHLPWRLSQAVQRLQAHQQATCTKPKRAWWCWGPAKGFTVRGARRNVFEGLMVFSRERAIELGGYDNRVSGQCVPLLQRFRSADEADEWDPDLPNISYAYRWADGHCHISGGGDSRRGHERFGSRNRDFGDGRTPVVDQTHPLAWARERVRGQFDCLFTGAGVHLSEDDGRALGRRLLAPWADAE